MAAIPLFLLMVVVAIACLANGIRRWKDKRDRHPFVAFLGFGWAAYVVYVLVALPNPPHNLAMETGGLAIAIAAWCLSLVSYHTIFAGHNRDIIAAATSAVRIPVEITVAAYFFKWGVLGAVLVVLLLVVVTVGAVLVIVRERQGHHHGHSH